MTVSASNSSPGLASGVGARVARRGPGRLRGMKAGGSSRVRLERCSVILDILRLGSEEHWIGVGLAVEDRACGNGGPGQGVTRRHAGAICPARTRGRAGRRRRGRRNTEPTRPFDDGAATGLELGCNDVPGLAVVAHLSELLIGMSRPLDFKGHMFLRRNS